MNNEHSAGFTETQVAAAARALADRSATICNVGKDDNWKFHGDTFIADARLVLEAAAKVGQPQSAGSARQGGNTSAEFDLDAYESLCQGKDATIAAHQQSLAEYRGKVSDLQTTIAALNQQLAAARNESLEDAISACYKLMRPEAVFDRTLAGCIGTIRALASHPAAPVQPTEVLSISWPMPRYKLEQGNSRGFMDQNPDGDWCRWLDVHPNMAEPAKPVAWGLLSIQDPELTNDEQLAAYWERKGREVTALYAAPAQAAPPVQQTGDVREAWEYSFTHSSAIGNGDTNVGPCLTYDRRIAYGVGCFNQRKVVIGQALATTLTDDQILQIFNDCPDSISTIGFGRAILAASGGAHAVPDGWQPISTAPEDRTIDILMPNGTRWAGVYHDRICNEWRRVTETGHMLRVPRDYPTHWHAIPAAPTQDQGEGK